MGTSGSLQMVRQDDQDGHPCTCFCGFQQQQALGENFFNMAATTHLEKSIHQLTVVMVGWNSYGAGKTSLLHKYLKDTYEDFTHIPAGIDFTRFPACVNIGGQGKLCKVTAWDAGGQTRFRNIALHYFMLV